MNTLIPLNSSDFIWPQVRDKWIALEDLFVYSKVTGPNTARLKAWRDSWTADEKFYLIKYYPMLRLKNPDPQLTQLSIKKLFSVFSKYFPHVDAGGLHDFFGHQSYLIPGIIGFMEESWLTQLNIEEIFFKYSLTYAYFRSGALQNLTQQNPRAGLFFIIEKLISELADKLIDFQVKTRVSFILKNQSYRIRNYLSQGIWSHQKLFESRSLGPDESPKKKNKKKRKTQEFYAKKKLPPSWMIAAYIHGLYCETHFSWQEQKVTKQKLKKNVGKALNQYILSQQKTVVQHFKRLIYALYADKLSTEILDLAGLGGDISISRGLTETDLDLLQNFYEKWRDFSQFNDSEMSSDKLVCHKIRVYLQYHGFDVSLSKNQVLSVVSKAMKTLPSMGFSLSDMAEWQENFFVQGLSQSVSRGWLAIKKYGPVAVKIAIFGAILLDDKDADISDFDHELLAGSNPTEDGSTQILEGAAQGKGLPSEAKSAKDMPTIEEMIAEHFSGYLLGMVEDYLDNEQTEILLPLVSKFPWLEQVKGALTDTWEEYYYRLTPEVGEPRERHEKNEAARLNILATILQVQPSWVIGLLDSFGVELKDLEDAHEKALSRYLTRPLTHRIMIGEFFSWREKAQACWNILGNEYTQNWNDGLTPPLALPHIGSNNPKYPELLQNLISFLEEKKTFKARDCFRKYFSPALASAVIEAAPEMIAMQRDESWLEFALAFDCDGFSQLLIRQQLVQHTQLSSFVARIYLIDDRQQKLQDVRDLFFLSLKYDKNASHIAEVKEGMRAYSATDISFEQIIALAENTTTEQFKNVFYTLLFGAYNREQRRLVSFDSQIANAFFEKLGDLSPRSRQDDKICTLREYAQSLSLKALKNLIKYTSDNVLEKFFQKNLIIPSQWQVLEPLEQVLQTLVLSAYNYGLIETAQKLIQMRNGHSLPAGSNVLTYWQIFHLIYAPESIGLARKFRSEDLAFYDTSTLSRSELKALLMHSARRALVPLARVIMQENKFQQENLSLGEYYQLLKNLQKSIATPRSKSQYLEIILKDLPSNQLTTLCIECYNRKIFLVDFVLQIYDESSRRAVPHWQRAYSFKGDSLMHQLLEAILPSAPVTSSQSPSRGRSRWPSFASVVVQNNSLCDLTKSVLSLDLLDKLIQKRWYHAIHLLAPYHKHVVKEQWLPLYDPEASINIRKTDYYRSFEDYMIYLIKNKVLHPNPDKTIEIIYQYWKKEHYNPSTHFVAQLLKPVVDTNNLLQVYDFDEKQKKNWLKVVLKLSYMWDKNSRRRRAFWDSFASEQTASIVIHRSSLVHWMQKVPYTDILQPYMKKNRDTQFGLELQHKFPIELERFSTVVPILRYFRQGYRTVMRQPSDLVAGYHIRLLRLYLLECFRQQLSNPALAVRAAAKEQMSVLMKTWLYYYGTDLETIHAARHRTAPPALPPSSQNFLFQGSERYWELVELNTYELIENNLTSDKDAEDLQYLLNARQDRLTGYRAYFETHRSELLQEESCIEWKTYLKGHQDLNVNPIRPTVRELPKVLLFSAQASWQSDRQDDENPSHIEYVEPSTAKKPSLLL